MTVPISHALVLPDQNFSAWFRAAEPYTRQFERVVLVRTPAGYDLNRFRNVSAVQAPNVWLNNDALQHIRRIYPSVVRVDMIQAATPEELTAILATRIQRNDRFGETVNNGAHLHDRFVIGWPSEQRPARIIRKFNTPIAENRKHEGIDIYTIKGSSVRAAVAGTVAAVITTPNTTGYGKYIQISTDFKGQTYLLTYTNLQGIGVSVGQAVKQGDLIAQAVDGQITLIVQSPGRGLAGYSLPDVLDPTPLIYWDGLRLRTTEDGLRIRERPGTDYPAKGQVYLFDNIETMELHGTTLAKVGQQDVWIRVRAPTGIEGFAAAWFLTAQGLDLADLRNISGVNLDITHALGRPSADRLRGLGWVRLPYNVSQGRGSVDFGMAERLYRPYMERYTNAGQRNIVILGHQTYGEGQGLNWPTLSAERWDSYSRDFANACRTVAQRYAGTNLVGAYQIWNEQDTPAHLAQAAVALTPEVYAKILSRAIQAIRSVDQTVKIITGGHVSGAGAGPIYARATLNQMSAGTRPDGIAFHAYGLGAPGGIDRYSQYGSISTAVRAYGQLLDAPVWITEWGVLDVPNEPASDVTTYALAFVRELKNRYPDKVAAACWYAWADTMHNGYGLVDRFDRPKQPLYDEYTRP